MDDREAESAAAGIAAACLVEPHEALEDAPRSSTARRPVVLDGHEDVAACGVTPMATLCGAVPGGVVGEVAQQLAEQPRIAVDPSGVDAGAVDIEPVRPQPAHLAEGDIVEIDRLTRAW